MPFQQNSQSSSYSRFSWFGNLCGKRRRGNGWTRTTPDRELAASPFGPKTARFYGVEPLFPEPSPTRCRVTPTGQENIDSTLSVNADKTSSVSSHPSNYQPAWTSSSIAAGEKLERWLGENLRTIPETERYEPNKSPRPTETSEDNRRATFLFSVSTPVDSSFGGDDFELIIQGTSPQTRSQGLSVDDESRPNTSYTAAFLSEDPYGGSREAIAGFLAAMRDSRSYDRSTIASRSTEATTWALQSLRPGPGFSQSFQQFQPFQTPQAPPPLPRHYSQVQSGGRTRSNSHSPSEYSTELCFSTAEDMSEYALERRNTMKSTGTFGLKSMGRRASKGHLGSRRWTEYSGSSYFGEQLPPMPEAPVPAIELPWRTISVRAVQRSSVVGKPHVDHNCPRADRAQCRCSIVGEPLERTMTMNSRVQRWVSVQQEQYIEELGAGTSDLPALPTEVRGPHSARLSLGGSISSRAPTLGNGAFLTGDLAREILVSLAPSMRLTQPELSGHNKACPCYANAPVPEYREVDPNPTCRAT